MSQSDVENEKANLLICKLYDEFLKELSDNILLEDADYERVDSGNFCQARNKMRSLWLEVQPKSRQRRLNEFFPCLVNEVSLTHKHVFPRAGNDRKCCKYCIPYVILYVH